VLAPGEIDRLVLLASPVDEPERLTGRKLFEGSAHAKLIIVTPQGEKLMRQILRFLTAWSVPSAASECPTGS
jgi:hypothetical protein